MELDPELELEPRRRRRLPMLNLLVLERRWVRGQRGRERKEEEKEEEEEEEDILQR